LTISPLGSISCGRTNAGPLPVVVNIFLKSFQ